MNTNMKVGLGEKIGYGIGDLACNLIFSTATSYLMYYYTDIAGLTAVSVATLFLVARIWDAINDPIMGMIVDKTNTRFGKFRPYILFGSIFLAIFAFLCYVVPTNMSAGGKLIYAYITYIGLGMSYTLVNLPYSALTSAMSNDSEERTKITTVRMIFAVLSGVVVAQVWNLVDIFGKGNETVGYRYTTAIMGVVSIVLFAICFFSTKERVYIDNKKEERKHSLKEEFNSILLNSPLIIITIVFMLILICGFVISGVNIYFFKYNLQRSDLITPAMTLTTLSTAIGMFTVPYVTKMFGKKKAGIITLTFFGVLNLLFFINYKTLNSIPLYFVIIVVSGIFNSYTWSLGWSMLPDTIEYAEYKVGFRAEGLIYSMYSFGQKMGMALAGLISGQILAFVGYKANDLQQTQFALDGIAFLRGGVPFILCIASIIIISFYPLTEKKYLQILDELNKRKSIEEN